MDESDRLKDALVRERIARVRAEKNAEGTKQQLESAQKTLAERDRELETERSQRIDSSADVRELLQEMEVENRELHRINEEVQHFASILSHDLKNHLLACDMLSEWLEEDLEAPDVTSARQKLVLLRQRIQMMRHLTMNVLEYSLVGSKKPRIEDVDAAEVLEEVVHLFRPPEGMRVRAEGSLPCFRTDRTLLFRVLQNLVGNAIHHHDREQGEILVSAREAGSMWEFGVTDDGPGVPPKFRETIFEAFKTLRSRDEGAGSGLGLSIVKKIVEFLGGKIWLEPVGERGTSFRFSWPVSLE